MRDNSCVLATRFGIGSWSRVLPRPFPKGTVPFGGSNVPFGSAPKPTMCPLAPPQNQHIFNSYLNLKTGWALSLGKSLGGITHKVHMQQVFGTDNYYIQAEGCGHEV